MRLPPGLRNLDPLWARCGLNEQSWDPSRVLIPVAAIETSTTAPSSSATTPARTKHTAGLPAPTALPSSATDPSMSFVPAPIPIPVPARPDFNTRIKHHPSIRPETANQEENQTLSSQASMTTPEQDGMAKLSSRLASSFRGPSQGNWSEDLIEEWPSQRTVKNPQMTLYTARTKFFSKSVDGKTSLMSTVIIAIPVAIELQRNAVISQEIDSKSFAALLGPSLVSPTPAWLTDMALSSSIQHKSANRFQGSIAMLSTNSVLQDLPNVVASSAVAQISGVFQNHNESSTSSMPITDHSRDDGIVNTPIKPIISNIQLSSAASVNTAVDVFPLTLNSQLVLQASSSVNQATKICNCLEIYPVMFAHYFCFVYHNRL